MYNKYANDISTIIKEQIKNAFPVKDITFIPENTKISGEPTSTKQIEVHINQKKFLKAKRENPDADKFYVKQINSYEELYE